MVSFKVLITGGAGFLGFHMAKYLVERGHEVLLVDNFFRGKMDDELQFLMAKEGVKFVKADLTVKSNCEVLDKDVDQVCHFAAINGTRFFYEIPHEVLRVNIAALINILDWVVNSKCDKVIFASSSEVYAGTINVNGGPIPTPENVPLVIENIINPRYSYGVSKIAGELLCLNYSKAHGFHVVIPRYHNVYGPRMGEDHVIPQLILKILDKEDPLTVQGGSQTRAFCYVDDAVSATYELMNSSNCDGEIINIGSEEEISILGLLTKLSDISGFHPKVKTASLPQGSVLRRCPDISKMKRLTGWQPRTKLDEGLKKTYGWYANNYYR